MIKFSEYINEAAPTVKAVEKELKKIGFVIQLFRVEKKFAGFGGGSSIAIFFNEEFAHNDIVDIVTLLQKKWKDAHYKNDAIIIR